jgi:hypothetical protein
MYIYIYIYMYICIHIYKYICIHTLYIYKCVYVYTYIYIHKHVNICSYILFTSNPQDWFLNILFPEINEIKTDRLVGHVLRTAQKRLIDPPDVSRAQKVHIYAYMFVNTYVYLFMYAYVNV